MRAKPRLPRHLPKIERPWRKRISRSGSCPLNRDSFVRGSRRPGRVSLLDWARDSAWRFMPTFSLGGIGHCSSRRCGTASSTACGVVGCFPFPGATPVPWGRSRMRRRLRGRARASMDVGVVLARMKPMEISETARACAGPELSEDAVRSCMKKRSWRAPALRAPEGAVDGGGLRLGARHRRRGRVGSRAAVTERIGGAGGNHAEDVEPEVRATDFERSRRGASPFSMSSHCTAGGVRRRAGSAPAKTKRGGSGRRMGGSSSRPFRSLEKRLINTEKEHPDKNGNHENA